VRRTEAGGSGRRPTRSADDVSSTDACRAIRDTRSANAAPAIRAFVLLADRGAGDKEFPVLR
jgi:hypothetical protein